jgi:MoxR-like ATPase
VRELLSLDDLDRYAAAATASSSTATSSPTRSQLADATRNPSRYGLEDLDTLVDYGASPRGPISVIHAARSLALLRGRGHVIASTSATLAPDVLRHRLVLSYDALSESITADDVLDRVLAAVEVPPSDHLRRRAA